VQFELFIHNFLHICAGLISLIIGIFILLKDPRKKTYILFFLVAFTYALYSAAYLLTVNIPNAVLSSFFAFAMIIAASTVVFNAHLAFATFGIEDKHKTGLRVIYGMLLALYAFYAFDPNRIRLASAPRGYLPNFFAAGPYYWVYVVFFFLVIGYFFAVLILLYRKSTASEKNRLKYFFLAFGWGYSLSLPIFLTILHLPTIDPIFTSLIGLYTIPLAYGVYQYDLLNINIAVKNALIYGFFTVLVGAAIIVINLGNGYVSDIFPDFPIWFVPLVSSILVVSFSLIIWNQIRQVDLLKYEFVNNISHKFRTPLTRIRWLTEDLRASNDQAEKDSIAAQMQFANMRLFELTDAVINTSKANELFFYHFSRMPVSELLSGLDKAHKDEIAQKKLNMTVSVPDGLPEVSVDKSRLQFALQILLENAVRYTPDGGSIQVSAQARGGEVSISFHDTGIGMTAADLPKVFSKFYRSADARRADTEGMGLGLFMARTIIEKHLGRVTAESAGEGKGSTFSVILPAA